MSASNNFDFSKYLGGQFNEILGGLGGKSQEQQMADNLAKIAENSRIKVLEEENAKLKQEIERLHQTILRCPKCGTKLRMPSK